MSIVVALLVGLALPNPTVTVAPSGGFAPAATHIEQNWGKDLANTPSPLGDCIGSGGSPCFNPGTNVTWILTLDICQSSTTVCSGATQLPIKLLKVTGILSAGETYILGSQTATTSPSSASVFSTGSCASLGAPPNCAFDTGGSYVEWNFSSPTLTGHPQAVFSYGTTLSGPDGSSPSDFAIANYTYLGLANNPIVQQQVYLANPILNITKSCPTAVENNTAIAYHVTVNNTGHENATGVDVVDAAPAGVTFTGAASTRPTVSFSPTSAGWNGNIPANSSVGATFDATVNTSAHSVTNYANITESPANAVVLQKSASCTTKVLHPAISVKKVANPTLVSNLTANTITVTANVTNTGDTTLYNVSAVDSLAGTLSCGASTLTPGAWTLCTGSYTLPLGTPAKYSNDTVVANGTDKLGTDVTATDHASVQILHPSISVSKTALPGLVSDLVGNTIYVNATVTNTGDATLNGITAVDNIVGPLSCPSTTLAAGGSMVCTGTYVIPMGYPGDYSNDTVTVQAFDQFDNPVGPVTANASVLIVHPAISVVKTVTPTIVSNLTANTIDVTANVTNVGDTPLYDVGVVDTLAGPLVCPSAILAPGAWENCTGTYTIPAGASANWSNDTANASASDLFGNGLFALANASVQIVHPSITIFKSVDPTIVSNLVSNTIDVFALVTNTGDSTLYDVAVVDSLAGPLFCPESVLTAGAFETCTGSYVIPAGTSAVWSNDTATVTALDQFANPLTASSNASVRILHPAITVVKTVDPTVVSNLVANTVDITANVTNTGDSTLYGVGVVDSIAGPLSCPFTTLAPGSWELCTGSYIIPKGTTANWSNDTVNATGFDQFDNEVSATDNASVQILHPSISVVKTVDPTVVSDLTANTIDITANMTNTGDSTLYGVGVVDSIAGPLSCPFATLAPGAWEICTGSYIIPKGTGANWSNDTVNATGFDQFDNEVSATDNASVQILHPSISVVKTVDPTVVSDLTANTIDITANVTNTGDSTLYGVGVVDSIAGPLSCPFATLAPGAWEICTGSYVIPKGTSANWSNDTVNATGFDQFDNEVSATDNASVQILHPSISVTKKVSPTVVSNLVDTTVTVSVNITNTGDATLYNVGAVDSIAGTLFCPSSTLVAGASETCTGTYVILAGTSPGWSNDTANGSATDVFGNPVSGLANASVEILGSGLVIEKSVHPTVVSDLTANTIYIQVNVTNTGGTTVTLTSEIDSIAGPLSCPTLVLAPGASETCTASYVIPKGDAANWSNDTATVNGTDQFGNNLSASSVASVQILHPSISVVKTVDPTVVSDLTANTIDVTANVTNTGDSTLFDVSVTDSLAGTLVCPSSTLAPGAWELCTGSYVIPKGTSADWSNDTANATAVDQFDNGVSATDNASVQILHPSISVVKTVDPTVVVNVVDNTISVFANVTNTGDATLFDITAVDTLAGVLICPDATLAPGAFEICTGSYVIPKGTVGPWSNDTVNATGVDLFDNPVSAQSNASVEILSNPHISIVKTVCPCEVLNNTATTIHVYANVTNNGSVTLYNVSVIDSIVGPLVCPLATLAPGQSEICTGSYVIPKGTPPGWSNDTATASGCVFAGTVESDPTDCVEANSSASVQILGVSIAVEKIVSPSIVANNVNSTVDVYAYVTNTGAVTLYNVSAIDSLAGALTCPLATLLPGESEVCFGSYVIPKGTAPGWSNDTVLVGGCTVPSSDLCVVATATASVEIEPASISVLKLVSPTIVLSDVNTTISVYAKVTNTGGVELFNISAVDTLAGVLVCPFPSLLPGESEVCTGSYVIPKGTTALWSNDTVTVKGCTTLGTSRCSYPTYIGCVTATGNASVQIQDVSISVEKVVYPSVVSNNVSNTIDVFAKVTNTGSVTLYNVTATDSIAGPLACPLSVLAPGESETCTGFYVIPKGTTATWSNDTVTAKGCATKDTYCGLFLGFSECVTATSSASVMILNAAISVVKYVSPTLVTNNVAHTISVSAVVTNTGTVTLYGIHAVDTIAGTLSCPLATLAPGQSETCTGSYVIPKGAEPGWSNDTVTATGCQIPASTYCSTPSDCLSATASASVQIVALSISVAKKVSPTSVSNTVANPIAVSANVTNTGSVTIYDLVVVDSLAGLLTCPSATLAPGASETCTGSYTIPKGAPAGWSNDTVSASGCLAVESTTCVTATATASVTIVAPPSSSAQVTDTEFCALPGGEFNIVASGDVFRSTNPGQFYYNVYTTAGMAHGSSLTMTIPYPFVTSGAVPGQVFAHLPPTCGSAVPSSALNFHVTPTTFGLSGYGSQLLGSTVTVTFTLEGPSVAAGTPLWFSLHLNYGLKGNTVLPRVAGSLGCPSPPNNGTCAQVTANPSVTIGNLQPYTFANSLTGTNTIASYTSFGGGSVPAGGPAAGPFSAFGPRIALGLLFAIVGQVLVQRGAAVEGNRERPSA